MAQIIPIASGKGGVGKSLLSANLAIALGQQGKRVVLVDLDLGASNLHLVIGQHPGAASLGSWFTEKTMFKDIILPTDYQNVSFVAGDSQIPDLTSLKHTQKIKLIRNLKNIDTDYLILDLGAGTHQFILDMFLLSPQGIVVSAPAVTATLNGYLFLKNAVFRLLYTTFKKNTPGRELLDKLKKDSASMQKLYIPQLVQALGKADPGAGAIYVTMSDDEVRKTLNDNLDSVPHVVGFNNHMGSAATSDERVMDVVLKVAKKRGLFFVDSFTHAGTVCRKVAKKNGMRIAKRDIFLDNDKSREKIMESFNQGKAVADKNGYAVMIGHVWSDELAKVMIDIYPNFIEEGYCFESVADFFELEEDSKD